MLTVFVKGGENRCSEGQPEPESCRYGRSGTSLTSDSEWLARLGLERLTIAVTNTY